MRRRGYTFIELIVTMASSAILMGGLASVLFISTKAITPDATATQDANRSSLALAQLMGDVRLAMDFTERTARAVTFTVPDRDADGDVETVRYSWSGTSGDPLQYQYNSGSAVTLLADVKAFNLTALTRTIAADSLAPAPTQIAYQSFAEAKATSGTSISVAKPTGTAAGNLLIAALAVDGNTGATLTASGWTLLSRLTSGSNVGVGVWWKIAGGSEPTTYTLGWSGSHEAYGWIMRFTGAHATTPLAGFVTNIGKSSTPTCAATTTSVNNSMVVRILGMDKDKVNIDNPGMTGHTAITMDRSDSNSSAASGGATWRRVPAKGTTGAANFTATNSEDYVTFSVVIAPAS
jgi:hypothetical protein